MFHLSTKLANVRGQGQQGHGSLAGIKFSKKKPKIIKKPWRFKPDRTGPDPDRIQDSGFWIPDWTEPDL